MEKSGGSIRFESEEGNGAAFYGILPLSGSPGRGGDETVGIEKSPMALEFQKWCIIYRI